MSEMATPLCKRCDNNNVHPKLNDLCSECFYMPKSLPYSDINKDIVINIFNTTSVPCYYCKSHAQYNLLFRSKFRDWEVYGRDVCIGCVYKMEYETKKRIMQRKLII